MKRKRSSSTESSPQDHKSYASDEAYARSLQSTFDAEEVEAGSDEYIDDDALEDVLKEAGLERLKKPDESPLIPCEICGQLVLDTSFLEHQASCHKRSLSHPSKSTSERTSQARNTKAAGSDELFAFHPIRVRGLPSEANVSSITISELIPESVLLPDGTNSGPLQRCFLSNYMIECDWILDQCPVLSSIPVTLAYGQRSLSIADFPKNFKSFIPHLSSQWGVHHSKMAILIYPRAVRVSVMTANYIQIDWDLKSQGVWYQDFPLLEGRQSSTPSTNPGYHFYHDLTAYLKRLGSLGSDFATHLVHYNFSDPEVMLIPSVPGKHKGSDISTYGHMKLRKLLAQEPLPVNEENEDEFNRLIIQISSMGSLNEKWLDEFKSSLASSCQTNSSARPKDPQIELIWPTVENVRNSLEGYSAGGSICFPEKNNKPFLQKYLHSWTSSTGRSRAMPHIKTFARYSPKTLNLAWFVLGSHNLSKAAWGQLQLGGKQLDILHYEMSVLFLPSMISRSPQFKHRISSSGTASTEAATGELPVFRPWLSQSHTSSSKSSPSSSSSTSPVFKPSRNSFVFFPIPYTLPPTRYAASDKPWTWDVPHKTPDIFGHTWRTGVDF